MTRRSKLWLAGISVFALINAAGAGYAAAVAENLHAGVHVALMLVAMYPGWRIVSRVGQDMPTGAPLTENRLEQIQQSVDAVAVEVERIGEAQRFSAKLQQERVEPVLDRESASR